MAPENLDIKKELLENKFRVSIFGSARVAPGDQSYEDTFHLAEAIGAMGVDLGTGGGPGLMEAAAYGHKQGDKKNVAHNIGLNIELPFEQKPNVALEYLETHQRFSTRLDEFMLLSNAIVVMPGGIGTCLEFFYTWQLLQVRHVCHMPIVLVGKMWRKLIEWVIDNPLQEKYLDPKDFNFIVLVDNWKQGFKVIKQARDHFNAEGTKVCMNWQQYGKKVKKLQSLIEGNP